MRISLLLKREPFGEILVRTLEQFLPHVSGLQHTVTWYHRWLPRELKDEQLWLCNIYLNAIFLPDSDRVILDPVISEFTRSTVIWRRLVQRLYVSMASCHPTSRWMAQAAIGITPPLTNPEKLLIIGGNQKLRLLDRLNGLVYGVLKYGFDVSFIKNEIYARKIAESINLPVPRLDKVSEESLWFRESYVTGIPINRLSDPLVSERAQKEAMCALQSLYEATIHELPVRDYVARLVLEINQLVSGNRLLSSKQHDFKELLSQLQELLEPYSDQPLVTVLTHGDFQPGNILVHNNGIWLIDWEYAAHRQVGYDVLVYSLRSRFPEGLSRRMQSFWQDENTELALMQFWPMTGWNMFYKRRLSGILFILEELLLHLQVNANRSFHHLDEGFSILIKEVNKLVIETRQLYESH